MPAAVFTASLAQPETSAILADHLALERARRVRRQLASRCSGLALIGLACGSAFPHAAAGIRWAAAPMCLLPAAWAWAAERRIARRLASRLSDGFAKKVIKSP